MTLDSETLTHLAHHTGTPAGAEPDPQAAHAAWRACWAEAYAAYAATGERHCSYDDQPLGPDMEDWLEARGHRPVPNAKRNGWETATPPGHPGPDARYLDRLADLLAERVAEIGPEDGQAAMAGLITASPLIGLERVTRALRANPDTARMRHRGLMRLHGAQGRN